MTEIERKEKIHKALRYGWHNDGTGFFGADLKTLCDLSYTYIGYGRAASTWIMVMHDDKIDSSYHITEANETDSEKGHIAHFLCSANGVFKKPKTGTKGRSLKIDPRFPGANIYYQPQLMKRAESYVSPNLYYDKASDSIRYKLRTKQQSWQNDYIRSQIAGEWKRAKIKNKKYGIPYDEDAFRERMDATHVGDIAYPQCGHVGYSASDVLAYRLIVLDIDCHNPDYPVEWIEQMADRLADLLIRGCDQDGTILPVTFLPASVVKTGRGLHLYFPIAPVYAKAVSMVKAVTEKLCDEYNTLIEQYEPDLHVDRQCSLNLAGFRRMPGSYNYNAPSQDPNRFGEMGYRVTQIKSKVCTQEPRDIKDMMHAYDIPVYSELKESMQEKAQKRSQNHSKHSDDKNIGSCRRNVPEASTVASDSENKKKSSRHSSGIYTQNRSKAFIPLLRDKAASVGRGLRNDFLFVSGTLAYEAGLNVQNFLDELNGLFANSLSSLEVQKTARSADKGKYHYKTETITDFLGLDNVELKKFGLTKKGAWIDNVERDRERKEKKAARDSKVISLLKQGKSISAVATETGHCRQTIRNIWDAFVKKNKQIKQRNISNKEHLQEKMEAVSEKIYPESQKQDWIWNDVLTISNLHMII